MGLHMEFPEGIEDGRFHGAGEGVCEEGPSQRSREGRMLHLTGLDNSGPSHGGAIRVGTEALELPRGVIPERSIDVAIVEGGSTKPAKGRSNVKTSFCKASMSG